jgi:hypothetical protein
MLLFCPEPKYLSHVAFSFGGNQRRRAFMGQYVCLHHSIIHDQPLINCTQILLLLAILTLVLSSQHIFKLLFAVGGLIFWHIIPVLAAIPSSERSRLVMVNALATLLIIIQVTTGFR